MPSIRVNLSTDLNITGGLTGIGTTNPAARLDVAGQITVEETVVGLVAYQLLENIKVSLRLKQILLIM